MSTPYTLMRCRMKDLISCFNACKLPIEEDESDHQKAKSTSVCDDRKREREQKVEIGTVPEKGEESPVSWQSCESEEDDYIVFYFKDDAAGGNAIEERVGESSSERKQDVAGGGDDRRKKRNEIGKIQVDANSVNESLGELRDALGESSDSSTSSFAFPTVQSEWPGSPVLMPRPEGTTNRSSDLRSSSEWTLRQDSFLSFYVSPRVQPSFHKHQRDDVSKMIFI